MKTGFILPSCNYNIVLNKEELQRLLEKGHITMNVGRTSCFTSRSVFNSEESKMDALDRHEVLNDLRFNLDSPVADLREGIWPVQFLDIVLDKSCKEE